MMQVTERIFPVVITLLDLLVIIIGLVILWIIVSIPVYIAGKIVTHGKSTLGEAMGATLLGPIVYAIVLITAILFLGEIVGTSAYVWAYILALIAWIGIYKSVFKVGWLRAFAIALLAIIVFAVLSILIYALFSFPALSPLFPRV